MEALRVIAGGPCGKGDEDTCGNGDCPTVYAVPEPGMLAIQGYDVIHPTPDGESVVMVPEKILKEAARARGWL
ncbi:hypothetical protein PZB75_09010 [Streptomyces sp. AM 4-1-1]|uniref:hypothetical protein n=1 Tax=unclassified Streptomyces TaxID=2593676 RepID=UPI0023B8E4CD|nr:hypothetical protein [Streptomyces sp. AM 4-1-1]WEH33502.1 hypothetical protein PZB75_09010 [Streptomyces sp. AM 4-1-1]